MTAPVLYIIFNRLDTVQKSFVPIKGSRPERLYIAADGPRECKVGESEKCKQVRDWVLSQIDWECDVKTLFREKNLGCGQGPKQAIDWLFDNEEMGIILEDDCVADSSFFEFATQMLEKYNDEKRVSIICGSNFDINGTCSKNDSSYFYSVLPYTWGWATWRRNWTDYDFTMNKWNHICKSRLLRWMFEEKEFRNYWRYVFDNTVGRCPTDIWDYQFFFSCYNKHQLSIVPKYNLISNIGADVDATHSFGRAEDRIDLPTKSIEFPLNHPLKFQRNRKYDEFLMDCCYGRVPSIPLYVQIKRWMKGVLGLNK